ncbi:MAG: DNA polymerase III subunit delta [Bryobacterales bacterium]|nr:DNA polymerase III subunit delta [Bryobacterales bacterium]
MSPKQLLSQLKRQEPAPVYLFVGAEPYRRALCRQALAGKALQGEDREHGLTVFDLHAAPLAAVIDDACSLALFAPRRLIWVSSAEAALPRGRGASGEETPASTASQPLIARYLERPSPGVVVVFDASRYDLEGEDKAKLDRVRKFYAAIPDVVEFPRFTVGEARELAGTLASAAGLTLEEDALEALVDTLGADAMRIATEIEKLRLYAGARRSVGVADLAALVPDSSVSTLFELVDALGRRQRMRAFELLDTLVRQGEYMPLALNFLASLLRLALAAKETGLRSPQQIQQALSKPGRPVWRAKAEQVHQTARVFTKAQLEAGLRHVFSADRGLRDVRPSDRIVMERLILELAG